MRIARLLDRWLLPLYVALAVLYLALPVLIMILFSFNDPSGRSNISWRGFSLESWFDPLGQPGLAEAVTTSLLVALLATLVATGLGVLIGLALVRHRFRGRSSINLLIFLPMSTPEIVLGVSLLTLFLASTQYAFVPQGTFFPLGFHTILIAHIMFNISYVVITVRARLAGFNRSVEEAAMDLGADEWTTFWKVTFPLIFPGILAAAMLAFAFSIDDFVITQFTAGVDQTFPLWVYGASRIGVPPEVNVMGTIIFSIAILGIVGWSLLQRRDHLVATPTRRDR